MDIERLAVSHIDDLIARCPKLASYINSNDKTPFTDGHIDLYSMPTKTNADHIGRVDVQIKGRTAKDKNQEPAPYRVRVADLQAFLNVSGALYLVVDIHANSRKKKAYYALLNPFRVAAILRGIKPGQKTVTVRLKRFPKKPEKIEDLISLAATTKLQNPQQGFDPKLLDHATAITIHGFGKVDLSKPLTFDLNQDDYAAFIETEGGMRIPLPGEFHIAPQEYLGEPFKCTIASGHVTFENPIRRRLDDETVELHVSDGLRFTPASPSSKKSGGMTLKLTDALDARLKDLGFYLACLDSGEIRLDGNIIQMTVETPDNVGELRAHYRYLQQLETLFNSFNVPISLIRVSDISEERSSQLGAVYSHVVDNKPLGAHCRRQGRIRQPVGHWGLELVTVQQEEHWHIVDVFAPGLPFSLAREGQTPTGKRVVQLVTPYEMLDAHQMAITLNLHLDSIVAAYEVIQHSKDAYTLANHTVLRLIQAADLEPTRSAEFLRAAEQLNDWLIMHCGSEPHHVINRMQLNARRRELTENEQRTLRSLRRSAIQEGNDNAQQIELSCAILLGEQANIDELTDQMAEHELEGFKSWPIWNLNVPETDAEPSTPPDQPHPLPELWMKWIGERVYE